MAIRVRQTSKSIKLIDHNELANTGEKTHEELDDIARQVEKASEGYTDLDERLDEIQEIAESSSEKVDDHEKRITDNEDTLKSYSIRIKDNEADIEKLEKRVTKNEEDIDTNKTNITTINDEIANARGGEDSLGERLDKMGADIITLQDHPIIDLLVSDPVYKVADNSVTVHIEQGKASVGGVLLRQPPMYFTIDDIQPSTTYYIYLKSNGTYSYDEVGSEDIDSMLIGSVVVGSNVNNVVVNDLRYFLTKTDNENFMKETDSKIKELEKKVGDNETKVTEFDTELDEVKEGLSDVVKEVEESRKGVNGIIFDDLKDRLDNLEGRLRLAEGKGTVEYDSVFHVTFPPFSRQLPQRDFQIPRFYIGSNTVEVFLDGIRMDVDDDYIEYNETTIRFNFDVPVESRVTIRSSGSVVSTHLKEEYTYNEDGSLKTKIVSGGVNRSVEYTYDTDGKILRETVTEWNGDIKTVDYIYDDEGKLIRKYDNSVYYALQGGAVYDDTELDKRLEITEELADVDIIYEFDEKEDNIISESIYDTQPTPQLVKHTEFTYDDNGNVLTERVSQNGKTVLKKYSYTSKGNIKHIEIRRV